MFERMEISEQVYSGVTPYKKPIKEDSNCASHVRKHKGWGFALMTNAEKVRDCKRKKTMQSVQAMSRPVRKIHAWCMPPGTLRTSEKRLRTTPQSMPRSSHSNRNKPAPAATKRMLIPSISTALHKTWPPWYPMIHPSQRKGRKKIRPKT